MAQRPGSPRRVRLGLGASIPNGPNPFAQRQFLEALARQVPARLRDLARIITRPGVERFGAGCFDRTTELGLRVWARTVGIPYDDGQWMPTIRLYLQHWRQFPDTAGTWPPFVGSYRAIHWPILAPWHATEEREAAFRRRVEHYIAQIKAMPGADPTPETFTPRDFDAFVLEHVEHLPFTEILQRLGDTSRDESSTRKRNIDVARVLGLRLHRRGRGRPSSK